MAMIEPRGRIVPVLLSGGAGSRLWPLSRETYPKQLLSLLGENTLLQQAALRVDDRSLFTDPMVIANAEHRAQTIIVARCRHRCRRCRCRRDCARGCASRTNAGGGRRRPIVGRGAPVRSAR